MEIEMSRERSSASLPFYRIRQDYTRLYDLISNIQRHSLNLISPCDSTLGSTSPATSFDIKSDTFMALYRTMLDDLRYIYYNIDRLESSVDSASAGRLLFNLADATRLSASDFTLGSKNLQTLVLTIGKLKLLVPLIAFGREDDVDDTQSNRLRDDSINSPAEAEMLEEDEIRRSYDSLKEIERNCLLYLSAFPCRDRRLIIKERVLIQLWYGEGFIDPQQVDNDGVIEEVGRNILMLLREKRLINKQVGRDVPTTFWCMVEQVHTFVRKQAKEEAFFDFDDDCNTSHMPHLKGSRRACLLRSKDSYPSSCKLWAKYSTPEMLKKCETMRTLLNVDETVVDIRGEWFSKMRNLNVLHLGRWFYYERGSINVTDLKFLEELKRMKQLRLLSVEGIPTLIKLSDSVCKLASLKVLSLRGCNYLEELPTGIGSLKNLTHLDLTDCHFLYVLPKGLRYLSKLEVLKGFVIPHQIGDRQQKDACTLKDLLRLEGLRMLKLCVNNDLFPHIQDLQVFKQMISLYNLKITWKKNFTNATKWKLLRQFRYHSMKWWEIPKEELYDSTEELHDSTEELSRNNDHLNNLKKLKLHCFPRKTAQDWLDPREMRNLEKLSIVGGRLKTLAGQANENEWNVKTLCLRHLRYIEMDWQETRKIFPRMKYLNKYKCDLLSSFPRDSLGVLEIQSEDDQLPSE